MRVDSDNSVLFSSVKFMSLNVCGVKSKLRNPEFLDMLEKHDVAVLQESKTDDVDLDLLENEFTNIGYKIHLKNRFKMSTHRSGGILVAVKTELAKHVHFYASESKECLWFRISKCVLNSDKDLLVGAIYIPPEGTRYANINAFEKMDEELVRINVDERYHTCLMGDFNGFTSDQDDFVELTPGDVEENGELNGVEAEDITSKLVDIQVPVKRTVSDKHRVNNFGRRLLDFCKVHALLLLNGRLGRDQNVGMCTTTKQSTIDYVVGDIDVLENISNFEIHDFDNALSDVHCSISTEWKCKIRNVTNTNYVNSAPKKRECRRFFIWSDDKKKDFMEAVDKNKVEAIMNRLESDTFEVDDIVAGVSAVFEGAAKETLEQKIVYKGDQSVRKRNKTWFTTECHNMRCKYLKAKDAYRRQHGDVYGDRLKQASRAYKKTMSKARTDYRRAFQKKLREAKSCNPKDYWNMLNANRKKCKNDKMASLEDFFQHFKNLNVEDRDQTTLDNTDVSYAYNVGSESAINKDFEVHEIVKAVKELKGGKASGLDSISNDYLKSTVDVLAPIYVKLFNHILQTGQIPSTWLVGKIVPIFKDKGDRLKPENYRGISLLSCFGKLFTSLLNMRLTLYLDENAILSEIQTGFRKSYSTLDHVFLLNTLIKIFQGKGKKLFCAFVDFKQAFDSIWRVGLWEKLVNSGITGNILKVIVNMYQGIKSCVFAHGDMSQYFGCHKGVRQGENLSPLLFSLFLNDIESFLVDKGTPRLKLDAQYDNMLSLLILLYADDAVILSHTAAGLQTALNSLSEYCKTWALTVNVQKTKVVVFAKRRNRRDNFQFKYNDVNLDIVHEFTYLGVLFSSNGSFLGHKKHKFEQANKSMFALLKNIRQLSLPMDLQLELFDRIVVPLLLYACETWGYEKLDLLEKLHLRFLKYILNLKTSTPTCMVYGESGRMPIRLVVQQRMVNYFLRTVNSKPEKLSRIAYHLMHNSHDIEFPWYNFVKSTFDNCGLSGIWINQDFENVIWLQNVIKNSLKDQYIQEWRGTVRDSVKCVNYRMFKTDLELEPYLLDIPEKFRRSLCKLRTANHKLPIERGRYSNLPRHTRLCDICGEQEIGDEFHFLLKCPTLGVLRGKYIPKYYQVRPNSLKFEALIGTKNKRLLLRVAKFVHEAFLHFY